MEVIHEGIAEYIGANVSEFQFSLTSGGNVFIDHLPANPDRVVAVMTTPSPASDSKLPYDPVSFQVIVRCEAGSDWALRRLEDIYDIVHGLRNTTLPDGTEVIYALVEQTSPFRHQPDENGRTIFSSNYRGEVRNVTAYRS